MKISKFFKKTLSFLVLPLMLVAACVFASPAPLFAQDNFCQGAGKDTQTCKNIQKEQSRNPIFGPGSIGLTIAQTVVFITGAAAVIMVIIGGFRYVISGGDPSGVQGAKNTIIYAMVGLVVAIFAQVIVSFVLSRL